MRVWDVHPPFSSNDDLPSLLPPAHGQQAQCFFVRACLLVWWWSP